VLGDADYLFSRWDPEVIVLTANARSVEDLFRPELGNGPDPASREHIEAFLRRVGEGGGAVCSLWSHDACGEPLQPEPFPEPAARADRISAYWAARERGDSIARAVLGARLSAAPGVSAPVPEAAAERGKLASRMRSYLFYPSF